MAWLKLQRKREENIPFCFNNLWISCCWRRFCYLHELYTWQKAHLDTYLAWLMCEGKGANTKRKSCIFPPVFILMYVRVKGVSDNHTHCSCWKAHLHDFLAWLKRERKKVTRKKAVYHFLSVILTYIYTRRYCCLHDIDLMERRPGWHCRAGDVWGKDGNT